MNNCDFASWIVYYFECNLEGSGPFFFLNVIYLEGTGRGLRVFFVNIQQRKKKWQFSFLRRLTNFTYCVNTSRANVYVCGWCVWDLYASVCVCVCVCSPGGFNPALISQLYQSIQCFVHHVSSLSTINGNVPCDTVHLIKVVCLTIRFVPCVFLCVRILDPTEK